MREDGPADVPLGSPPMLDNKIIFPRYQAGENRHYRLPDISAARALFPATRPVNFWFRTRYVSATGVAVSPTHPHVLRLTTNPLQVPRLLSFCFDHVPSFARLCIRTIFPEWFLPCSLIIKPQRKGEEELFDTERRAYHQLKAVQGILVPKLYGQVKHNKTKWLLLEDVGGVSLASPEGALLELEKLSELLKKCFRTLHSFDVHQLDPNPGNYQLVDGKLKALDFGDVDFDLSEDGKEFFLASRISSILGYYRDMQRVYEHDGELVPVIER
ncbi:hypothetical protein F4803DRAFT_554449 [Xylaria telfairii]|nr:hypothetical protein F4803DRAFT_554449 [Xylaria telfairii]